METRGYVFILRIIDEGRRKIIKNVKDSKDGIRESERGEIIIALDEGKIRPIETIFGGMRGDDYLYLSLKYEFQGKDKLNMSANAYKFFKEKVAPCINNAVDRLYFELYKWTTRT